MKVPKIHFISLVSVDLDSEMLPYFLPHYAGFGLSNYVIFLHEGKSKSDTAWSVEAAKSLGMKAKIIPQNASFQNGELKKVLFENFAKACSPEDYILTADADEIQHWNEAPVEYIQKDVDVVLGTRVDRFNDSLREIDPEEELETQYPFSHENLSRHLWPKRPRANHKIVLSRAKVPVQFEKSKTILGDGKGLNIADGVLIEHYKWRSNIFERLENRLGYAPNEIQSLKNFFEVRG